MENKDFTTSFLVDETPGKVFNAINNVRGWWSKRIDGGTEKEGDVFVYQRKEVHKCTMKILESVPDKKVVWQCLDNYFDFTQDQTEWTGTTVEFEITAKDSKTEVNFTHRGLVPGFECYDICFDAWTFYIKTSLQELITTGKGQPNPEIE